MPRNRRVRTKRNRPQRNRSNRKVSQVSSGIPTTRKRVSGNPPIINEISSQTVKVTFNVDVQVFSEKKAFSVTISDSPFTPNLITTYIVKSNDTNIFYLDIDEIYMAAFVRVFGSKPADSGQLLYATEMALLSASFYGPTDCGSIRMGVDFGPGMPGAMASDSGSRSVRPAVKITAPRLHWDRINTVKPGDAAIGYWIYGFSPLGKSLGAGGVDYANVARVDCTVTVRRSWFSANTASAIAPKAITDTLMA
jgi:hypothetical protein